MVWEKNGNCEDRTVLLEIILIYLSGFPPNIKLGILTTLSNIAVSVTVCFISPYLFKNLGKLLTQMFLCFLLEQSSIEPAAAIAQVTNVTYQTHMANQTHLMENLCFTVLNNGVHVRLKIEADTQVDNMQ